MSKKSFTLIELLVAIALFALLVSIVVIGIKGTKAKARDGKRQGELDSIRKALELYYTEKGEYPTTTDWVSLESTSTEAQKIRNELKEWLPTIPEDPLYKPGGEYSYQYIATTTNKYQLKAKRERGGWFYVSSEQATVTQVAEEPGGGTGGEGGSVCDIEISDCATLDQPGKTYCLTQDIINSSTSSCINITADNITFDGQGHTIDGDDVADYGIYLYRDSATTTSVTIKNCTVSDWDTANIYLYQASGNSFDNVILLSSPDNGIFIHRGDSNTLTNVTSTSNSTGINLLYSDSNTLTNVTSNFNSTGILLNTSYSSTLTNVTSNFNSTGIFIRLCDGHTISNSIFADNSWLDFRVYSGSSGECSNTLTNVIGTGNKPIFYAGSLVTLTDSDNEYSEIILCNADGSYLENVTLDHTGLTKNNAILLDRTDNAVLKNINVINLEMGLYLSASRSNTLINITSTSNSIGLYLDSSNECLLKDSHIENNSDKGVYSYYSGAGGGWGPCTFYNNVFNNDTNFYIGGANYANNWSTSTTSTGPNIIGGPYIGGNYWTNPSNTGYSDTCTDSDGDGICDTPYDLLGDGTNVDNYPLKP